MAYAILAKHATTLPPAWWARPKKLAFHVGLTQETFGVIRINK
jgi:hypothetical protein